MKGYANIFSIIILLVVVSLENIRQMSLITGDPVGWSILKSLPFYVGYAIFCFLLERVIDKEEHRWKAFGLVLLQLFALILVTVFINIVVWNQSLTAAVDRIGIYTLLVVAAAIIVYAFLRTRKKTRT